MSSIAEIKEREITETPLLLFDCVFQSGHTECWSTHSVEFEGRSYEARVLRHNAFEFRSYSEDGVDGAAKISLVLGNADSRCSELERSEGWKSAKVTVRFLFYDLKNSVPGSEARVLFLGVANSPEEITESTFRVTFNNRLNLQRVVLPDVRIQKRCPWVFPATVEQRQAAVEGQGLFYRCGYSPDQENGCGNQTGEAPFTSCDCTRTQCEQRGMFRKDILGRTTARFGGIEFVPSSIAVRSYGEKGTHTSAIVTNEARYNDFVPLIYGTGWYHPPVVFARNDGNLTHLEVLLGMGEIQGVLRVIANDIEIPVGRSGSNMTATGWYNIVSLGARNGSFNLDFTDSSGVPVGDPYGSMAVLSVVLPNTISDGRSLPRIQVLVEGGKLDRWSEDGEPLGSAFTSNPAWIILDVLRRSGWQTNDIDLVSFAKTAADCDQLTAATGVNGEVVSVPRGRCNLVLQKRRSAADVVRGIRNGSGLYLTVGSEGLLQLRAEGTLYGQQSEKPEGSNATERLNGGWPAYEFGDGSNGFSGILRADNGASSVRVWSKSNADSPNRYSGEFQDEFNGYQQDSLSLTDSNDVLRSGQEVTAALSALGLPNVYQAAMIARLQLNKAIAGNTYVEFATNLKGLGLKPGDLITVSYLKEGWQRRPFRVSRVTPGPNYETTVLTAQVHDDVWYAVGDGINADGTGQQPGYGVGTPNPLLGTSVTASGETKFGIVEQPQENSDGGARITLTASFVEPRKPTTAGVSIPLVSLHPEVLAGGGTLEGDRVYYYAISAVHQSGEESALSFLVRAEIPEDGGSYGVRLHSLSFSAATAAFRIYRGTDPARLLRIGADSPVGQSFVDTGIEALAIGPADPNYDHAKFYWRMERLPECSANIHSGLTIGNPTLQMIVDEYRGMTARIVAGKGAGQERVIVGNSADTLTVASSWDTEPDGMSSFTVSDSSWILAAVTRSSPVEFEIPNRAGATVQILGRSANVQGNECPEARSPVTRWRIAGSAGSQLDDDVPGAPIFGVGLLGRGSLEVAGIGFGDLCNTRSINSGTLILAYWNELGGPCEARLGSAISSEDFVITVTPSEEIAAGDLLQIDREIVVVDAVLQDGTCSVVRGSHGSHGIAHEAQSRVYRLGKKAYVLSFPKDFFGTTASGSYSYPIHLPNARISGAEFFVTNSRGNSPVSQRCFTQTIDSGLRTGTGGQLCLQVNGWLAAENDAVPPLVVESTTAVRDVFAVVREGPSGGPLEVNVKTETGVYCRLSIPEGERDSNVVSGFDLTPLPEGARLTLDVVSVPSAAQQTPGQDLTVTIRL